MTTPKPPADRAVGARLPGPLGELARAGHGGAALQLVKEWGGTKRSIPGRLRPGSPLVELIGEKAAAALIRICGPAHIDIPSKAALEDSQKAAILRAEGSTREIAMATGTTERYVRMVKNAGGGQPQPWHRPRRSKPQDERQVDLEAWLKNSR